MGFGSRILKLESTHLQGEDVLSLQKRIVAFGSKDNPVPCNGIFDDATEKAVKKFQKYFSLAENGIADNLVFKAISDWFTEMRSSMETFLSSYKCDHSNVTGDNKAKSDKLWQDHVKGKLGLIDGGTAGNATTCTGFGNNLSKVALTNSQTFDYKCDKDLDENPGVDCSLFWLMMGILKIYGTKSITVNNGYRCNYKYWFINWKYGPASLDNHTGHAVDFTLPGADITRPNGTKLTSDTTDIIQHCKEIRTDLEEFGIVETFDATTKNRGRTEPGKKPNGTYRNWVHVDTTVYTNHQYIQTVDEAMEPIDSSSAVPACFPVALSKDCLLTKESIDAYFKHTEKETEGGYYPVGSNTLWHGGLHIFKDEGTEVFACMPGKVVCGRLADDAALANGPFGHRNFILLEHEINEKKCYSLYMHLKDVPLSDSDEFIKKVTWLQGGGKKSYKIIAETRNYRSSPESTTDTNKLGSLKKGAVVEFVEDATPAPWKKIRLGDGTTVFLNCDPKSVEECTSGAIDKEMLESFKKGDVVKVDRDVRAGDLLWKMGKYGPKNDPKGLVHWEIFSEANLVESTPDETAKIEDKKPAGQGTAYVAGQGIKVRGVTGPARAKENETITCFVTKINVANAPDSEFDKIKWDVKVGEESVQCTATGYKLEYSIPENSAGKTITIRPFMNSPSNEYCVKVAVISGWTSIEDADEDFNAENEKITTLFGDLMADGTLTREELKKFYADDPDGKVEKLRHFACKFASEWGVGDLGAAIGELKKKGFAAKVEDYQPYLWWPDATSAGVSLPSAHVWHYNPIAFLQHFGVAAEPQVVAPVQPASTIPQATDNVHTDWKLGFNRDITKQNDYNDLIYKATKDRGINPYIFKSLIAQESAFNEEAHNKHGYAGLTQIAGKAIETAGLNIGNTKRVEKTVGDKVVKEWVYDFKGDERFKKEKSIEGGAKVLAAKMKSVNHLIFKNYTTPAPEEEKWKFYLAAYNGGEGTIHKAYEACGVVNATWDDIIKGKETSALWSVIPEAWGPAGKYKEISTYPTEILKRASQDGSTAAPADSAPAAAATDVKAESLKKGNYDDVAVKKYPTKKVSGTGHVTGSQVEKLQKDLATVGIAEIGTADGDFGQKTEDCVKKFQEYALKDARYTSNSCEKVEITFKGKADGVADKTTLDELALWIDKGYTVPQEAAATPDDGSYIFPYLKGKCTNPSMNFNQKRPARPVTAKRERGHAGVDLYAHDGEAVYAVTAGRVVHYESFGADRNYVLQIVNDDKKYTIRYGELVAAEGIKEGVSVKRGQLIGHVKKMVSDTMLHFELYKGVVEKNINAIKNNKSYPYLEGKDKDFDDYQRHEALLNPTQFIKSCKDGTKVIKEGGKDILV